MDSHGVVPQLSRPESCSSAAIAAALAALTSLWLPEMNMRPNRPTARFSTRVIVAAFSVTSSLLISVVRKTREIGLLNRSLPATDLSLPEARVLYELAQAPKGGLTAAEIGRTLKIWTRRI